MRTFRYLIACLLCVPLLAMPQETAWAPLSDESRLRKIIIDYSELKDPFSVQFRSTKVRTARASKGQMYTVWCGELNAKNSIGAYSGWRKFYVLEGLQEKPSVGIVSGATAEFTLIGFESFCNGS